jgi:DtxR family Mn-dependent transcriptional regulator
MAGNPHKQKPALAGSEISATMRDYLAEIYRLSEQAGDDYVSTSALAEILDVSAPAVNRMVTRLKDVDLLKHEPYQGIRLTEAGDREALKHLRSHRIVEAFLVKVMGFEWHQVHREAAKISRAIGETVIGRMYLMADQPAHCPHGEVIPAEDGSILQMDDVLLHEAEQKVDLEITRVHTREPDRLEYLAALQLVPGTQLQLLNVAPFSGPIQLKLEHEYRIIGHNLAEAIRVKRVE